MNQRLRLAISEPVVLMFSRRQVETCDVNEPLASLRELTADRKVALEFCGRVSLVIDGYNDDPRELFEIPEVRAYLKRLDQMDHALTRHFDAMNQLSQELNLPEEICGQIAEGVISLIHNAAVEGIEGEDYR